MLFHLSLIFSFAISLFAQAQPLEQAPSLSPTSPKQDQIIVTATRSGTAASELPFSAEVISEEEWQEKGPANALASIPGISATSNGGVGQTKSLFLRGAKSEHLLVLVDGVVMNDPLAPSRGFDFGQIPASDIDHIEIIKGPQSVLFGSDAMAGVIQIFTKRGLNNPTLKIEGGSYGSGKASVSAYGFRAGAERSDGFSAADRREGNEEIDGYRAYHLGGIKDFQLDSRSSWRNTAFLSDSKTDTDRSGGRSGDSRNTFSRNSRLHFRSELLHSFENGIDSTLAGSANIIDREDNTSGAAFYKANLWKIESLWRKSFLQHDFTLGAEFSKESGRSSDLPQEKSLHSYGAFLQDQFRSGALHGSLGARIDFPSEQGNPQTYRAGLGYWLVPNDWKIKGSLGTGFKSPSLYQTYSSYGTRGLSPEKSIGGDIGLEFFSEKFEASFAGYQNRYQNLIEFNTSTSKYYNLGRALTQGIELSLAFQAGRLRLENSLTTTRAYDRNSGQDLLRRPKWNDSLELSWQENARWKFSGNARAIGPREDLHPILYTRQPMPSYFLFGAFAQFQYSETGKAYLRIDNILDRRYQETSGYGTAGFSAFTGLELSL